MRNRVMPVVLAIAMGPYAAWSQVAVGPEFQVSSATAESLSRPAVSMDGTGRFVVVWHSVRDDLKRDVVARMFDASANPLMDEFTVNTHTTGDQMDPRVASAAGGEFVIVWNGKDGGEGRILARLYDAAGAPLSSQEWLVDTSTTSFQTRPAVAARADGHFVVVWASSPPFRPVPVVSSLDLVGRHFDGSGVPATGEFPLTAGTALSHDYPEVARSTSGAFVVVYYRDNGSFHSGVWFSNMDVFAQRFDATGARLGGEIRVNSFTTSHQFNPSVAMRPDGGFLVVWDDRLHSAARAQRFDPVGSRLGDEFRVNTYTTGLQGGWPKVAADSDGNFVVVWQGERSTGVHVFGQRLDPAGSPIGSEFRVGTSTADQFNPAVAVGDGGYFVVVWSGSQGSFGIRGQRFGPDLVFYDGFESGP